MNALNKILWQFVKIALYLMIVTGIVGLLTVFIVIPQWVKSTEILVPNLIGKTYWQAVQSLAEVGLKPNDQILVESSGEPKGDVIAQDPVANFSIKPHQTVKLTVSIGADLVPVPSVIGKAEDAAHETLKSANFLSKSVARVYSENYLPNTVIAQSPAEGSNHHRNTTINLLVSLGSKPRNILLPDLENQPINEILPALEAIGMRVEIKYTSHPKIPEGNIIAHDKLVRTGDQISLEVSGNRGNDENSGRWLPHKHTVSEEGNKAREVKIVVIDDYRQRDVVKASYAPGTIIDLEKRRVRVFGPTQVIVFEDGKKMYERFYQ